MIGSRRPLVLDTIVVVWVVAWLAIGLKVGREVDGLKELSGTVRTTGSAVESAGRTLESLEGLPVVGPRLGQPAQEIQEAGRSVVRSGRAGRESIEALSVLLGLAVAVIPSLTVAGLYLPRRLACRRESRALRALVRRSRGDPGLQRFLAARALQALPLDEVTRGGREPWRASEEELAAAELRRHGLR